MKNIKLTIEYNGLNYHGWQKQPNAISIQGVVEKALEELTGQKNELVGSSRTDAGVHAYGQVANFLTDSFIPAERFSYALNRILPNDIVIKASEEVDINFHSRYNSKGKEYQYKIYNSLFPSAILNKLSCHVSFQLNISEMKRAAEYFIGKHDFAAFMAVGSSVKSTVRTIFDISVGEEAFNPSLFSTLIPSSSSEEYGSIITINVRGDGFLYNMVRIIAGTLIEIGMGKISAKDVADIIESRDRKKAGKTATAYGLYLVKVFY